MSNVIILAAAVLCAIFSISALLILRNAGKRPLVVSIGAVSCKRCGARILVSNPPKLHDEFSVKCGACDTRKLYNLVDLKS